MPKLQAAALAPRPQYRSFSLLLIFTYFEREGEREFPPSDSNPKYQQPQGLSQVQTRSLALHQDSAASSGAIPATTKVSTGRKLELGVRLKHKPRPSETACGRPKQCPNSPMLAPLLLLQQLILVHKAMRKEYFSGQLVGYKLISNSTSSYHLAIIQVSIYHEDKTLNVCHSSPTSRG